MRSVFTAGVLDVLLEQAAPPFDWIVGVSAGAACATSYLAGQRGRNLRIFREQMTGKRFIDPGRALRGGHYFDMGWLMGSLALDIDPIDAEALHASVDRTRLEVVAVRADTGVPEYLPAQGPDFLEALHATVAIPVLYRGGPARFRGRLYFDGGVVDPLPVRRALRHGATDLFVVPTHPAEWVPAPMKPAERLLLRVGLRAYPAVYRAALGRHRAYRDSLSVLAAPPAGVTVRVAYPPASFRVTRYTKQADLLDEGYRHGREAAEQVLHASA